ncbi:MAG: hypothetical protein COA79_19880 [Planctomycetota bacterium]|nr:MAG: hypothetical protein COA79_19880 [Planctomycetota bacterium]
MLMPTNIKIFIVIPAFNESLQISNTIESLFSKGFHNIIVVDDGSTDSTFEDAKSHGVIVVQHPVNLGVGAATATGMEVAKRENADVVVTFDADGQHHPDDIENIIQPILDKEKDVVIGNRDFTNGMPSLRRIANFAGNFITWAISGLFVSDSQSGLKAFSKTAIDSINISASGYEYCSEIFREIHYKNIKWCEISIQAIYTDYSKAKGQSFATGLSTASKLVVRSLLRANT